MFGTVQQLLGDNNLDKAGKRSLCAKEIHDISRHLAVGGGDFWHARGETNRGLEAAKPSATAAEREGFAAVEGAWIAKMMVIPDEFFLKVPYIMVPTF